MIRFHVDQHFWEIHTEIYIERSKHPYKVLRFTSQKSHENQGCKAPDTFHDKVPSMHNDYDETHFEALPDDPIEDLWPGGSCVAFLRSFMDPRH